MFKRLGELITKWPLAVIAIWIILIAISVPMALSFESRLQYDMTSFIPHDLRSFTASDKYDEVFPGDSQSQILVVIQSNNTTAAMYFMDRLNETVYKDPDIKNMTGTVSIYAVQREALVEMTPDLYDGLIDLYDNASDISEELYNATDTVRDSNKKLYDLFDAVLDTSYGIYDSVSIAEASSDMMYAARDQVSASSQGMTQLKQGATGSASMVYGVPDIYVDSWTAVRVANPSLDDHSVNAQAAAAVSGAIEAGYPVEMKALAQGYLQAFNGTWDAMFQTDPRARAQAVIAAMAPSFINDNVPAGQQRDMMLDVYGSFNLSTYNSASAMKGYVIDRTMAAGHLSSPEDRMRLSAIYDLGDSPPAYVLDEFVLGMVTMGMPANDSAVAREVYALGPNPQSYRIGQIILSRALAGLNETESQFVQDVYNLGPRPYRDAVDSFVLKKATEGLNQSESDKVKEVYALGQDPSNAAINAYVLNQSINGLNETESKVVLDIFNLGRDPGDAAFRKYASDKVADELDWSGNLSYMNALLGIGGNKTDTELDSFATDWVFNHGYDDPQVLPDSIVSSFEKPGLSLFIIEMSEKGESPSVKEAVGIIRGHVQSLEAEPGFSEVKGYVTGDAAIGIDTEAASMNDVNNIDKISIILIILVLGLYFRSFLTPFVPLIIIGCAIVVAMGGMFLLSFQVGIIYLVLIFMIVIMLGAGTDYCVFILSRYAEERSKGAEVNASIITAISHAGKSVASSGTTAMIGFGSLMLIDNGIFRSIGIGTSFGILCSMLVAITLVPAVLAVFGDRLFWPRKVYNSGSQGIVSGMWRRITKSVLKHSKLILLIALVITIPAIYIYGQMSLGMDFISMTPPSMESKIGYDLLNDAFGSGSIDRAMLVVTLPFNLTDASGNHTGESLNRIEALSADIAGVPGIDKAYSLTRPDGLPIDYMDLSSYPTMERSYYESYMDENTGNDGRTTVIYASFEGSPYSEGSQRAIDGLTAAADSYTAKYGDGSQVLIGGYSVGMADYQRMCTEKYSFVIPIVICGIFVVLMVLLRSVFTPLRLIVTLLMSIVWTLAIFLIVFQFWLQASITWILPIILFCTLMGLGIDYDIFLVTRVKEEVGNGASEEDAIEHAVEATGSIITLCGAVMAAAFGSMMISSMVELQEFGFVLFLAILLDATLIRLVLVPAVMLLMKKYNWWMPSLGLLKQKSK